MVIQLYFWWILDLHLPSLERICGRDAKDQSSGLHLGVRKDLGLDALSQCTVDLLHRKLITGEVML